MDPDPQWAPAYAGLARVLEDEDPPKAAEAAEKAIAIDPHLVDAHLLLAGLHLDADRDTDARAALDKILAFNPSQLEAHAMLAAIAYVKDDQRRPTSAQVAEDARHQSGLRRGLSRRRAARREQLPLRRSGGARRGRRWRSIRRTPAPPAISACT